MIRIHQYSLIVFAIVCITGCPRPDIMGLIVGSEEQDKIGLKYPGCRVTVNDAVPFMYKEQKCLFVNISAYNISSETHTMIASKSVIYSNTDTFVWRNPDAEFTYRFYDEIKDTVSLAPHDLVDFDMLFVSKKNFSRKLYRRSNKEDTLYLKLNLFNKDTVTVSMRNHHNGPIWHRY